MTQVEQKYKVILTAKQAELSKTLNNRGEIGIEPNPDVTDEAQQAGEREIATNFLNKESDTLKQVNLALKRIEEGTFGICISCDEELPPQTAQRGAVGSVLHRLPDEGRKIRQANRWQLLRPRRNGNGLNRPAQKGVLQSPLAVLNVHSQKPVKGVVRFLFDLASFASAPIRLRSKAAKHGADTRISLSLIRPSFFYKTFIASCKVLT